MTLPIRTRRPAASAVASRYACYALLAPLALLAGGLAARGDAPRATLLRVKRATVYLQVKTPGGKTYEGTGFFAHEPGLVVTNAHVLGMLEPNSRRPLQVDVVINSGETDSQTLRGQVLGVDRGNDLGVLRVQSKNLPEPLKLGTTRDLLETQEVYVFGFPFGKRLGKNITVSKSSVSSLRKSGNGTLTRIQVNGGMNPGNSGGPVTDTEGQVIGVAVSIIKDTAINFAIPSDRVRTFLEGRADYVTRNTAYHDGDRIKLPVRIHFIDPLGHVRKVAVEVWTGPAGNIRPPTGAVEPKAAAGDSEKKSFPLSYDARNGLAEGEVVLPKLPDPKHVFWIRPVATLGTGKSQWAFAAGRPLGMLVDRVPVQLKYRPEARMMFVELTSRAAMRLRNEDGGELSLKSNFTVGLREQPAREATDNGGRQFRMTLHRLTAGILVNDQPIKADADSNKMFTDVLRNLALNLEMDGDGNQVRAQPDVRRVPADSRDGSSMVSDQVLQSLSVTAAPLPEGTLTPLQTWKTQRLLEVGPMSLALPAQADLKFTYLGVRQRGSETEAVIHVEGTLRGQRSNAGNLGGSVTGTLIVSTETGQVASALATIKLDVDVMFQRQSARANGELSVNLRRSATPPAPVKKK